MTASLSKPSRHPHPHNRKAGRTDDWLTPRHVLAALGPFDLDPCAAPEPRPWPTAKYHWARAKMDGLVTSWRSHSVHAQANPRVWLNPPYGSATGPWVEKLADHGNGIALVFARTDTKFWHQTVVARATAILFLDGRLTFCYPDGKPGRANSGGPSALIAFGIRNAACLYHAQKKKLPGHFVRLRP